MKNALKTGFLVLVAVLGLSSAGYSQNVRYLNLNEALRLAEENNSDLRVARLDRLRAGEYVSQVYSENLFPSLTLNSRYTRAVKKGIQYIEFGGQTQALSFTQDNSLNTSIDLQESIPILGTPVFSGIRIAEYYEKSADENISNIRTNVRTNVRKAYFQTLLAKEVVGVNRETLENAEENLRVVEVRYRNGVATEFDYLRARVRVENLRPQVSQAENNFSISKMYLKNAIGLKDNDSLEVRDSLSYNAAEVLGTPETLSRNVTDNNVQIRLLRINRLINEELVTVNKANYLPKLYFFGQFANQSAENDDRSLSRWRFLNSVNIGLGLTWDLNLFKNSYKVEQARLDVRKSDEQIANVRSLLRTQTESILLRIDDARNRITAQEQVIGQAERGLELAEISFRNGVLNQIDVLDASLQLSQTRLAYLQAVYDYLVARSDLEQLLEK